MNFKHNIIKLPYDDIKSVTTESKREYHAPNGKKYPSITSVLSVLSEEAIAEWRARVGAVEAYKISKRASSRGTRVHKCVEDYTHNETPVFSSPMTEICAKKLMWALDDNLTEINGIECALYSDHLKLAGKSDLIGVWNGRRSIIDYKTSEKPKRKEWCHSYFMQGAGYAVMFEEQTGIAIDQVVVLISNDEDDEPQVFVEKRDDWVPELIKTRKVWQEKYGNAND